MLDINLVKDPSNQRGRTTHRTLHIPGQMFGFAPAYYNSETAEIVISTFANGSPAPIHLLEGLPGDWLVARTENGQAEGLKDTVVSGYTRDDRFYTREQAKATLAQERADRSPGSAYYDAF